MDTRAENDLSDVDEEIGTVKNRRMKLCTAGSIPLYVMLLFIASQIVCTEVIS